MQLLKDILLYVSNALLFPCLALLVLCLARTLMHVGEFAREGLERRRALPAWTAARRQAPPEQVVARARLVQLPPWTHDFIASLAAHPHDPAAAGRHLDDLEALCARRIERTALLAKLGPMLGLAGTLIPLGPALQGMAAGNVAELAGNLVVAFTAAVVGLAIAGPNFAISTVRRRWYETDLRRLESLVAALTETNSQETRDELDPSDRLVSRPG